MGIITWILFGAVVGWIASMIMGTNAEQGAFLNVIVGIIGAFIGGFIMSFFNDEGVNGFNIYSLLVAILGACILLFIVKTFRGRA